MKYRKKPIVIDAIVWDGKDETFSQIGDMLEKGRKIQLRNNKSLTIKTLEGDMDARIGDYVIKGINGELYPCKPDIFEKTYEIID